MRIDLGRVVEETLDELWSYYFTLVVEGADLHAHFGRLYEEGCQDAVFGRADGRQLATFNRRAATLHDAVRSAIEDVERAVPRARVTTVELGTPNHTGLVRGLQIFFGSTRSILRIVRPSFFKEPVHTAATGLQDVVIEVAPDRASARYEATLNRALADRHERFVRHGEPDTHRILA